MSNPLLPDAIPVRLAAVLCGRSLPSFRKHCLAQVAVPGEGRRVEVSLTALQWLIGAEITPDVYLHACRRLDHLRAYERDRNHTRRPA